MSPPQIWHVEVLQAKHTRKLPQLVQAKGFGENIGILPIRQNIHQFDFIGKGLLADKIIVHLNMLGPGVDDGVLHKLDVVEVGIVNRRRIGHLYLQILQ